MNIWILLTLIALGIYDWMVLLAILAGISIGYLFLDGRGKDSSVIYHLTHWSWWDFRV